MIEEGLTDKVAIVTGASRGIGRAIVRRLVESGAKVAFTYRASEKAAEILHVSLQEEAGEVLSFQADARDFSRAGDVINQITEKWSAPTILVNNAATSRYGLFEQMSEEDWDYTIEGTLKVVFNYSRQVLPAMKELQTGSIINISSINGLRGREGSSAYSAAKAAINGLTRTLAREVGTCHIRVNAIAPGYVDTESQQATPELIKKMVRQECALSTFTQPEEIAELVALLAGDRGRQITGQVLRIDAGQWV